MNVLVVEDHPAVRESLDRALRSQGHRVALAADGAQGLALIPRTRPDVIVLDVGLPDISGLDLCRTLRDGGDRTPVLMLTARAAVEDRVAGLDAGADDYLVKPFALAELLARIRALVRRSLAPAEEPPEVLRYADVELVPHELVATRAGEALDLTRTEFLLLELFLRNPGRVLTREVILDRVWGFDADTSSNAVEVYVGYLRRKLESGDAPRLVQTVRGFGYALRAA